METWRWIPYRSYSPPLNMAIDEAIMVQHREGQVPPTLRFYGWEMPTCSIGYFQKIHRELNLDELEKQGIAYVRRLTGGRTVFHDRELTYSLVASANHQLFSLSVRQSHQQISQGIRTGLQKLGLAAVASPEKKGAHRVDSSACFDSTSDYEITIQGKKVVGSAQTRQRGVLLQHGSIPIEMNVDQFFQLLRFPSHRIRLRMKQMFQRQAGAINEYVDDPVSVSQVADALLNGFRDGMGIQLEAGELTEAETDLAYRLSKEKYASVDWTLRR